MRTAISGAAVLLSATGLLVALLAPGRVSAAEHANLERAAKPMAPSAASVTKHVDSVAPPDEGTTQLPAIGDTQLPATPDTPRPAAGPLTVTPGSPRSTTSCSLVKPLLDA